MKAFLDAIHGGDEQIAGQSITQLTATLLPADTEIFVDSTIKFGEWTDGAADARIVVGGEIITCTGRTNTKFTGITRGVESTKIPLFHPEEAVIYDLAQNTSALDHLRRGFLVDFAIGEDLTRVARNLGIDRCPGVDDTIERAIIKAIAYLAKQPPGAIVTALDALFGSGNYDFYERLVTSPNRFFVSVDVTEATSLQGRFYLNSGEAKSVVAVDTVTVDYDITAVAFQGAPATGNIRVVSGAFLIDGENFILDDGVNAAVTFEFDLNGTVSPTAVLRPVIYTATSTEEEVRDAIIAAIAGAPLLDINGTIGDAQNVVLTNTLVGVAGNVTITETVAEVTFVITGMAGGEAVGTQGVVGVFLDGVATREGIRDGFTNYFTGGSFIGKVITLGTTLPGGTAVLVDYNAHPAHYLAPDDTFVNDGTDFPPYFSDNLLAAQCLLDQVKAAGVGVELSAKP